MKYKYDDDTLVIFVDDQEREELKDLKSEDPNHFVSDEAMVEFFEPLIANSDLDWVWPEDTGDLTSAPMLGVVDYNVFTTEREGPFGAVDVSHTEYCPIIFRWAFMEYEITTPLEQLLRTGRAVFVSKN